MLNETKSKSDTFPFEITPGLSSLIKVEDVRDPLLEAPDKVAEALVLFCQGLGLLPSIKRRSSLCSQGSEGSRLVTRQRDIYYNITYNIL